MSAPLDMSGSLVYGHNYPVLHNPAPGNVAPVPHAHPSALLLISQPEPHIHVPIFHPCVPFFPSQAVPYMAAPPGFDRPFMQHEHVNMATMQDGSIASSSHEQDSENGTQSAVALDYEPALPSVNNPSVNFSTCKSRFNGFGDIRPFITAILNFKDSVGMPDDVALRGLPLLLTDLAAMRWEAAKHTVTTWSDALAFLRNTYKIRPSPYRLYRHLFSTQQKDDQPTAAFVKQARALLDQLPPFTLTEDTQLDLVYGLLNRQIREKVNRNDCAGFGDLLRLAVLAEGNNDENRPGPGTSNSAVAQRGDPNVSVIVPENHKDPCRSCKDFGHLLVRMCQKTHNTNVKQETTMDVEEPNDETNGEARSSSSKMRCFYCQSQNIVGMKCQDCILPTGPVDPVARPLLTVKIYDKDFVMVVDTGAGNCVADPTLTEHLIKNKQRFTVDDIDMPTRDGNVLRQELRVAAVDVQLGGRTVRTSFFNNPKATESILGMDFILASGLVLDFRRSGYWTLRDLPHVYPLEFEEFTDSEDD